MQTHTFNRSTHNNQSRQYHILLKQITTKLNDNDALITRADKGRTMVVLDNTVYKDKVYDFISNNNIVKLTSDPTNRYVKELNTYISNSTHLFNERLRRFLKPCNAKAPVLTGLPKIHKSDMPIRPLVNFTTAHQGLTQLKSWSRSLKTILRLKIITLSRIVQTLYVR